MTTQSRPRRLLAAASVVSSVLLLTAACGGDGSPEDLAKSSKTSARPSGSGSDSGSSKAGSLDASDLKAVLLGHEDVPEGVDVAPFTSTNKDLKAKEAACQPVMDLMSAGESSGKASASAANQYEISGQSDVNVIQMAAFDSGGAADLLEAGVKALERCGSFTGAVGSGRGASYEAKKVPLESSADETVGIALTTSAGGQSLPTDYAVLRVGDLVAVFINLNQEDATASFPEADLMDRQAAKMRDAQK